MMAETHLRCCLLVVVGAITCPQNGNVLLRVCEPSKLLASSKEESFKQTDPTFKRFFSMRSTGNLGAMPASAPLLAQVCCHA